MHVQVVVFGVEWSTFSRLSDAGVTARLWLLYVIFMAVASRRRWGPERVQLGEDSLPPPLLFNGDVCETSSNKLTISGELGVGVCVYSFALEQILRWQAAHPGLGLRPLPSLHVSAVGLATGFDVLDGHFQFKLVLDQWRFFNVRRAIYPPPSTLNCAQMAKKSKWCELLDGRR